MGIRGHARLSVWQKSMTLAETCYRVTRQFPQSERLGLYAQIRRAAISIPSNIAEGHSRATRAAYAQHVSIALGSQAELETQLEIAERLGFAEPPGVRQARDEAAEVGRMLHGLLRALRAPSL